jgi:flavin-dependent thymidylate synthase
MKVELLTYTPDALDLLIFTKSTRLGGATLDDIREWSMDKKLEHLAYMRDTIRSSWEFVDYTFRISGVTRAFTHQLVRTRTASFAQEAQRVVDLTDATWLTPPGADADQATFFDGAMRSAIWANGVLVNNGMARQDARGVIPTNIHTSIIVKANLRTLSQMAELRLCTRTQGEYQDVFRAMVGLVVDVHFWAEDFIGVYCAQTGLCYFPRYGANECPLYPLTINGVLGEVPLNSIKMDVKNAAKETRHEAAPVVNDKGMAQ